MAGTVTVTYSETRTIRKVIMDWLSSAGGVVDTVHTKYLSGVLLRVIFIPDGGGTQPSNLYDVILEDDQGIDILAGQGADLSNVNTTNVCPGIPLVDGTTTSVSPMILNDTLELKVAAAGDAKGGQIILYMR